MSVVLPTEDVMLTISTSPYPGLRSFRRDESFLFFGRDGHTVKMLQKLQKTRFLAVIGSSGCGKSSLVKAGLIPSLATGFLTEAGSRWSVANMHPGRRPLAALAQALLDPTALGKPGQADPSQVNVSQSFLLATLRRGPLGLVEAMHDYPLPPRTNLLLLVDQFEEIFRFRQQQDLMRMVTQREEADAFVALLLATAAYRDAPIYVVLTMRSDFLGDCAIFTGLPEAINESQFLTPRLNRDQCRLAIECPARVFGGGVDPALSNQLLNEMGSDSDQLPLLQHALMRMWNEARVRTGCDTPLLTAEDFQAVESLSDALSDNAEEAMDELDEPQKKSAETIFRRLTQRDSDGRDTRRPTLLRDLAAVVKIPVEEAAAIVDVFRSEGRSFLMPPPDVPLDLDTMVDISHESLIRQWRRLKGWKEEGPTGPVTHLGWVAQEAESASQYRRLCETASLWQEGRAALWGMPNLKEATDWKEREQPSLAWAMRYGTEENFAQAMYFLDESVAAQEEYKRRQAEDVERGRRQQQAMLEAEQSHLEAERQQAETLRLHKLGRKLIAMTVFAVALAVAAVVLYLIEAEEQAAAVKAKAAAITQKKIAEASLHHEQLALALEELGTRTSATVNSHDGKFIVTLAKSGVPVLWSASGSRIAILKGDSYPDPVTYSGFRSNSRQAVIAHRSGAIEVWQTDPVKLVRTFHQPGRIRAAAFSPDGSLLAAGGDTGTPYIWNIHSGQGRPLTHLALSIQTLDPQTHPHPIINVYFFGNSLRTASSDGSFTYWNWKTRPHT